MWIGSDVNASKTLFSDFLTFVKFGLGAGSTCVSVSFLIWIRIKMEIRIRIRHQNDADPQHYVELNSIQFDMNLACISGCPSHTKYPEDLSPGHQTVCGLNATVLSLPWTNEQ
jgi:hypothetical protein